MTKEWLTAKEAAAVLGLSAKQVRARAKKAAEIIGVVVESRTEHRRQ